MNREEVKAVILETVLCSLGENISLICKITMPDVLFALQKIKIGTLVWN